MNIPAIYNEVMYGLLMKTKANEVLWNTTTNNNTFIVYFNKFNLSIQQRFNDNETWVNVELINNDGNKIDGFYIENGDDDWEKAEELYSLARRSALSINVAIQEMLAELSKIGVIGKKIKDNFSNVDISSDDIPF